MNRRDRRAQRDRQFDGGRILADKWFTCPECHKGYLVEGGWYETYDDAMNGIKAAAGRHAFDNLDDHPSLRDLYAANGQPQPDGREWPQAEATT